MKLTRTPGPGTTKDTISWDRVPEAVGFKFTIDGKTSHTWDATKTSTTVAHAADRILVEALGVKDSGLLPAPDPEPVPTTIYPSTTRYPAEAI